MSLLVRIRISRKENTYFHGKNGVPCKSDNNLFPSLSLTTCVSMLVAALFIHHDYEKEPAYIQVWMNKENVANLPTWVPSWSWRKTHGTLLFYVKHTPDSHNQ